MKNLKSRRDFLKLAGLSSALSLGPIERLLDVIGLDYMRSCEAQAAGLDPARNYLNIYMPGAPKRFVFDQWLRHQSSDLPLHFNPMTATAFKGASGHVPEYRTFDYQGFKVPYLFSQSVNLSAGPTPISELLKHMMIIRGYGSGFDGHSFNAKVQMAPLGGVDTLSALSANQSSKTFEAIQWPSRGSTSVFNSTNGKALSQIPGNSPLTTLVEGFAPPPSSLKLARDLKSRRVAAFETAHTKIKAFSESESLGAKAMSQNLQNARDLMKKGVQGVADYWPEAVARYKRVVYGAFRTLGIPGISDRELVRGSQDVAGTFGIQLSDDHIITKDFDLRNMIARCEINSLAESLALSEYCLTESLVTSLEVMSRHMQNLFLPIEGDESLTTARLASLDMHGTGCVPALFLMNAYYRGLTAGLLELISVLKKKTVNGQNLWANTVIHIHGDFARSARASGTGSDHGFNSMVTSVFSGALTAGPYVVGNIKQGNPNTTGYTGSQGLAAPIANYNQKGNPSPQAAASTICELLGVSKNPYSNGAAPLAQFENGVWKLKFPGTVIEGA